MGRLRLLFGGLSWPELLDCCSVCFALLVFGQWLDDAGFHEFVQSGITCCDFWTVPERQPMLAAGREC